MTDQEALQEARRRWGSKGSVIHHEGSLPPWAMPYTVGIRKDWLDFAAFGHGMSWENAFAAAERCEQASPEVSERSYMRLPG